MAICDTLRNEFAAAVKRMINNENNNTSSHCVRNDNQVL